MPLYEYECDACGHRFEQIQKFSDPPIEKCPACGAKAVRKLISSPAIQFKGSGWYVTDYARKAQPAQTEAEDGKSAEAKAGADATNKNESGAGRESRESTSKGGASRDSEPAQSNAQGESRGGRESATAGKSKETVTSKKASGGKSSS